MAKWFGSIFLIVALVLVPTLVASGQQLEPLAPANSIYLPLVQVNGSTEGQCTSPGEGWTRVSLEGSCGWHLEEGLFALEGGNSTVVLNALSPYEVVKGPFDGQEIYEAPATLWYEDVNAPTVVASRIWIDPVPTPFECLPPGPGWDRVDLEGSCGYHLRSGVPVVLTGGDSFSWIDTGSAPISGPFENEEYKGPLTLWYDAGVTNLVTSVIIVVDCEEDLRPSSSWVRDPLQGSCGWHLDSNLDVSLKGGNSTVLLVKSANESIRGPFDDLEVLGPATLWYEDLDSPRVISTALLGPPTEPATPTPTSTATTVPPTPTSVPPTPTSQPTATVVPTAIPCAVPQGTPGEWDRIVDANQQPIGCGWQLRINTQGLTISVPASWKIVTESGEVIGPVTVQIPALQGASLWRLP